MSRNPSPESAFTTPIPDPRVMPLHLLEPLPYQRLDQDFPPLHPLPQTPPPLVVPPSDEEVKLFFSHDFLTPESPTGIAFNFFDTWIEDKGILHPWTEWGPPPDLTSYRLPYEEYESPETDTVKLAVQDYTQRPIANTTIIKTESYSTCSTPLITPGLDLSLFAFPFNDSTSTINMFPASSPVDTKPKIAKVAAKSIACSRPTAKRSRSSKRLHSGTPYPDTDATSSVSGDSERDEQAPAKRIKREPSESAIKWSFQRANSRGYTPSLVCYVNSCTHRSKTAHECCKHRDVHFPESKRFKCPGCQTPYTRASSLLRHLVTKDGASRESCRAAAGPRKTWGRNGRVFEVRAPVWFERGGVPQEEVEYWKAKWDSYN